jgi:hypothetical protein
MLENEELVFVEGSDFFSGKEITSSVPHSDKLLISTLDNGTFTFNNGEAKKWDTPLFSTLKQNQIYTAIRINDNEIAIYNLLTNNLMANYVSGFTTDMKRVQKENGFYEFSIRKDIFDEGWDSWVIISLEIK